MDVLHFGFHLGHVMNFDRSQPRNATGRGLEHSPSPGFVKALVIKTNRKAAVEFVDHAEHIKVKRRPGVLMANDLAFPSRLDATPPVGPAVHLHQAVRTFPGHAKQAARSMIFEAAAEDSNAGMV